MQFNRETGELIVKDKIYKIEEIHKHVFFWEAPLTLLNSMSFNINEFHDDLVIDSYCNKGFGTYLFNGLELFKVEDKIVFVLTCDQSNKKKDGCQWETSTLLTTLFDVIKHSPDFETDIETLYTHDDMTGLQITFKVDKNFHFSHIITKYSALLNSLIMRTELLLSSN